MQALLAILREKLLLVVSTATGMFLILLLLLSGGLSYSPPSHRRDTGTHGASRWICSSPISFVLRSTRDNNAIALNEIRQRLAEITESLEQARKREEEVRLDNNLLQGRRDGTIVETEDIVTRIKRRYANEIDVLSDQIESAQDEKKEAMSRMRSTISSIREEAAVRATSLRSELSNLESNLVLLRKEAATASKGRNLIRRSVEDYVQAARSASRKEIEVMKASLVKEKRRLKLERWDIDSRIQRAEAEIISVMKQLCEVKEEESVKLPLLSDLRASLSDVALRTSSQVKEMKEKRKAKGMFFDASFMGIRTKKREEMNVAKSISEEELLDEDGKLASTTLYYESLLTETEEQLRRINELSNKPLEMSGYDAIADAQRRVDILIQEKCDAISHTEDERVNALNEAANSYLATRDQYDATYENSIRNLEVHQSRSVQTLAQEDQRAERRIIEIRNEMEKMTLKLSALMKEERVAANIDYEELVKTKTDMLEKNVSQYERTAEEIRNVRSNLIFFQRELTQLEGMAGRNRLRLNELEEERFSFRQQMGRTMSIAISKLTRR